MNVDDRVRHKRHGQGVVVGFASAGDRGRYAKVAFDNDPEGAPPRLCTENRLVAIPSWERDDGTTEPSAETRRDRSIPYAEMDALAEAVRAVNADADRVEALIYNGRPYCEVWRGGAATIVFSAAEAQPEERPRRRRRRQ